MLYYQSHVYVFYHLHFREYQPDARDVIGNYRVLFFLFSILINIIQNLQIFEVLTALSNIDILRTIYRSKVVNIN